MKFEIFESSYLFHLHTDRTDGKLTIEQYFQYAKKHGIASLIFLEHIVKEPSYDIEEFADEISKYSSEFGIRGVVGFEAKILPEGELDIRDEHLDLAQIIGIAEHSYHEDYESMKSSITQIFETYPKKYEDKIFVWVHPGIRLVKLDKDQHFENDFRELLKIAQRNGVLIEKSRKYKPISNSILGEFPDSIIVKGIDAHSITDLNDRINKK